MLARGRSMSPAFREGDTLTVLNKELDQTAIGDIIVFYNDERFIAHRLLWKTTEVIYAKGDNTKDIDFFKKKLYVGTVISIESKEGNLDLQTKIYGLLKYYYLFYSLCLYPAKDNRVARRIIQFIFRGRGKIIRLLKRRK